MNEDELEYDFEHISVGDMLLLYIKVIFTSFIPKMNI